MIVIGLYYILHSARRCLSMKSKDVVRQAPQNTIASPWQYETVFYISWWAGLSVGAHCEAADTCAVQRCVQCTVHLYTGGTLDHRDDQWWRSYQGENMTRDWIKWWQCNKIKPLEKWEPSNYKTVEFETDCVYMCGGTPQIEGDSRRVPAAWQNIV